MNATDVFNFLSSILREIATSASMSAAYDTWDNEFCRKEVKEVWYDIDAPLRRARNRTVTASEVLSLSKDQLLILGFYKWDDSGLILIPLYLFNYITDDEELICINGDKKIKGHGEVDLDVRRGCIAYGFLPEIKK